MARIMPAAGPTRLKEPRVVVLCTDGRFDVNAVQAHPLVRALWADTVQAWESARVGVRRYSVHTGTPTVPDASGEALLAHPSAPPGPDFEAWETAVAVGQGINF